MNVCKKFIPLILLCLLMSGLTGCARYGGRNSCPVCMYRFDLSDFEKLNAQNQIYIMDVTEFCEGSKK